ncbi:MAG: tRNA (cytidine(34)-2'-O)-methyltransferase [Erysipelotrichaceae bacterium]|jgi:tRNA (cytidine/uridine-2'-O-)-methyltransferase|nr:tRNA (cytidine(34)-2'-O)-methyltransferase [Erysipelotrichaceae bacterium]
MIHIVLFEPEIPQNTGNIMRTCVATNSVLHLIEPLGFSVDEKHLRRAGLDYRKDLTMHVHPNWEDFTAKYPGEYFFVSRYGKKSPDMFDFNAVEGDIFLVFGKESTGIPKRIMIDHLENQMRLPMVASARSLNLSNCVAICTYECLRQLGYPGLSRVEVIKGEDFIGNE